MDWKKRLLIEYSDLREKIGKLDTYLADNYNLIEDINEKDSKRFDIMARQFEIMEKYLEILEERILLEMED